MRQSRGTSQDLNLELDPFQLMQQILELSAATVEPEFIWECLAQMNESNVLQSFLWGQMLRQHSAHSHQFLQRTLSISYRIRIIRKGTENAMAITALV